MAVERTIVVPVMGLPSQHSMLILRVLVVFLRAPFRFSTRWRFTARSFAFFSSFHFNLNWKNFSPRRAREWKFRKRKFFLRALVLAKIIILSSTLNPNEKKTPFRLCDNRSNKMPNFITTATVSNRKRYILWFITLFFPVSHNLHVRIRLEPERLNVIWYRNYEMH